MQVIKGKITDIDRWMELVGRVAWNFPGLETQELLDEHRQTVLRFMEKGHALCVKEGEKIAGILLFSRRLNMICCMAVAPEYRRRGIGTALVSSAMDQMDGSREISVTTFRQEDEKGIAPRALYTRFGFEPQELLTEYNYPLQRFVRSVREEQA